MKIFDILIQEALRDVAGLSTLDLVIEVIRQVFANDMNEEFIHAIALVVGFRAEGEFTALKR